MISDPRLTGRGPRASIAGPALCTALMLAAVITLALIGHDGDPTGLVHFGSAFAPTIHPPAGAVLRRGAGYDGQFFWVMAHDPLLLHDRTVAAVAAESFRLQRIAYPALAALLSFGQPGLIAWALIAVNVLVVVGITIAFSRYAVRRGWAPVWGLAVGLAPGMTIATMLDLSDALATAGVLGGLILWRERRRWAAAALLAVAVLAREPMALAVVAVAVEAASEAWRRGRGRGCVGDGNGNGVAARIAGCARAAWPVAVVPAVAFAGWHLYVQVRLGGAVGDPGSAFTPPLVGVWTEFRRALGSLPSAMSIWDLAYLALIIAAIGLALVWAGRRWRHPTAPGLAAALFALSLLVLSFGNEWSYTRLSAPLFACLLLCGLETRSPGGAARGALAVCAGATVLGVLVPLAIL
jgi:hypothetical protein